MMRRTAALLVLLACCACDPRVANRSISVSNYVQHPDNKSQRAKAGHEFYSVEMDLPSGLDRGNDWHSMRLIDDAGQSYRIVVSHFSASNDEPKTIGATFEIPEDRQGRTLIAGDYAIDLQSGVITKTR
jgi:hypothetical protein